MQIAVHHQFMQLPAGKSQPQVWQEHLEQTIYADQLGYDGISMVEHHFFPHYSIGSSQITYLAYMAARTQRVRFLTNIILLPFRHPVLVAEDAAVLDMISGGRLDVGVGRGYVKAQFDAFGVPMEESAERFREALEIILKGWTSEEPWTYEGRFWSVKRPVVIQPRPFQKPHPPLSAPGLSPRTIEWLARNGIGIHLGAVETVRIVAEDARLYRERLAEARAAGVSVKGPVRLMRFVLVADTMEEARRTAEAGVRAYIETLLRYNRPADGDRFAPGYEYYKENWDKMQRILDDYLWWEQRSPIVGTPDYCLERLHQIWEQVGGWDQLICWMSFGGVPHQKVMRSLELFAERVMPELRKLEVAPGAR